MSNVTWGNRSIPWSEAKAKAAEAQSLAHGLFLVTTQQRQGYEGPFWETAPDWFAVAQLIERVRAQGAPVPAERIDKMLNDFAVAVMFKGLDERKAAGDVIRASITGSAASR